MKFIRFLILLAAAIYPLTLQAQPKLSVYGVNTAGFPEVHARFSAVDATGKLLKNLSVSDFLVTENGIPCTVTSVTCPDEAQVQPVSLALSIDISSSMMSGVNTAAPPLQLAKMTAERLIGSITLPPSEIALQVCDDRAVIVKDFTTDAARLLEEVLKIKNKTNNDFAEQLLNPKTGILNIAKQGRNARAALLLTDAWWKALTDEELQRSIDTCTKYNIRFYAVFFSDSKNEQQGIRSSLRALADATGGRLFEDLLSISDAEQLANELQGILSGGESCEIVWQGAPGCDIGRTAVISLPKHGMAKSYSYFVNPQIFPRLDIDAPLLRFGPVVPGNFKELPVTITARFKDILIQDITADNPGFSLSGYGGSPPPFTLPMNQSRTLTIRFAPADSAYTNTALKIITGECRAGELFAAGGFPGKRSGSSVLKIKAPNGGEMFAGGSDTVVTWDGIFPGDTVRLDYSIDGGRTWQIISDSATGLRHRWKVPSIPSNECLMRAQQFLKKPPQSETDTVVVIKVQEGQVVSAKFTADGSRVTAASGRPRNRTVWMFDASSGNLLQSYDNGITYLTAGTAMSADGREIISVGLKSASSDVVFTSVDALADVVTNSSTIMTPSTTIEFSLDGSRFITSGTDNIARVHDATTYGVVSELRGHTASVNAARFSSDRTYAATAGGDRTARIWNAQSGASLYVLNGFSDAVLAVAFSPDETRLAVGTRSGELKLYSTADGQFLKTYQVGAGILDMDWSADGKYISVANDSKDVFLLDPDNGAVLKTLQGHNSSVSSCRFSPDGTRLITGGALDSTMRIWQLYSKPLQQDTSDARWRIVMPSITSRDLDMGRTLVGFKKDSVLKTYICNTSDVAFTVDSISIAAAADAGFAVVSGVPAVIAPQSCRQVEFRFEPKAEGIFTGKIFVHTNFTTLGQNIRGEAVDLGLKVAGLVDFGRIPVGSLKDSVVEFTITNTGKSFIKVLKTTLAGPDTAQFSILDGGGEFTLNSGDSRTMKLRFSPGFVGRTSSAIAFTFTNEGGATEWEPAVVPLFGEGICGVSNNSGAARIQFDESSISTKTGRVLKLPLKIIPPYGNTIQSIPLGFSCDVRFKNSMLHPVLKTPKGIVDGRDRVISISGSRGDSSDILANLAFKVMFGDTDRVVLKIENFRWADCEIQTEAGETEILVTDICITDGKARYFKDTKAAGMMLVQNPAENGAELHYRLAETGETEIILVDILGQNIGTVFKGRGVIGEYSTPVDFKNLGAGTYFLVLKTRTQVITERVEKLR